jgi:hypothetical protein
MNKIERGLKSSRPRCSVWREAHRAENGGVPVEGHDQIRVEIGE